MVVARNDTETARNKARYYTWQANRIRKKRLGFLSKLDLLGLFQEPIQYPSDYDYPSFKSKWRGVGRGHRFLYLIYILPLILLVMLLATILFIPWTLLPKSFRPRAGINRNGRSMKKVYIEHDVEDHRDVLAPLGYGPGSMSVIRRKRGEGDIRLTKWISFWLRVWDGYELLREVWDMFFRQGLQIAGVFAGSMLLIMQIVMLATELGGGALGEFIDANTSGGKDMFMDKNPDCAYVVGTGLANWGTGWESFGWYAAYHGFLFLLCIMLIADEVLNVRMGLFAPQWSRMGTGYTIIFLAACTINTSPNWGWKIAVPLHQVLLVNALLIGAYNVLRPVLFALDCTPDRSLKAQNRRNGRYPLRPWTTSQWKHRNQIKNFRVKAEIDKLQEKGGNAKELVEAEESLDKLYPSERAQVAIGDRCWEMKDKKGLKEMKKAWGIGVDGEDGVNSGLKELKEEAQRLNERGSLSRRWLHGFPIEHPPLRAEDYWVMSRNTDSSYLTEHYKLDKYLIYKKGQHKNINGEMKEIPQMRSIGRKNRPHYAKHDDVIEPTDDELSNKKKFDSRKYDWESKEQFEERQKRNRKGAEDYYGNHNWVPAYDSPSTKKSLYYWYLWFDARRIWDTFAATYMLGVHVGLMFYNLGSGTNNWPAYRAEYDGAADAWKANGGPSADRCQYYQGTSLPIWIRSGEGSIKGVFCAMLFYAIWEFFIMHLCLGVVMVALTNNRTYGMHFPWPVTLIGPRLSSVSLGWTLGFVGVATLQMGLFHYQPSLQGFARGAGYVCVTGWVLHLFRNEPMREFLTRRPWPPILSLWAHEYTDGKKTYKSTPDGDEGD